MINRIFGGLKINGDVNGKGMEPNDRYINGYN